MKSRAYITYLSTDNYMVGVATLWESLQQTNTNFSFYCLVTDRVSFETIEELRRLGIKIIHSPVIRLPQNLLDYNTKNCHTSQEVLENYFQKLIIFGLDKFEKLVYLDADMIVLKNIDDLFDKPHMAGAIDHIEEEENRYYINGGLIVIEPSKEIYKDFMNYLTETSHKELYEEANRTHRCFWDTDFYNARFKDWAKDRSQIVDIRYNVFINAFGYYKEVYHDEVKVVHLTGKKPWLMTLEEIYDKVRKNEVNEGRFYEKYLDFMRDALHKINVENFNRDTDLCLLMKEYGSDKCGIKHNYTKIYNNVMWRFRNENIVLFELGIGSTNPNVLSNMGKDGKPGASLYAWRDYFPNGKIYGADIDKDILFEAERIKTAYCDQTNSGDIEKLFKNFGEKEFDFMILDGLHTFEANKKFFENSIYKMARHGYLFIEDIYDVEEYKEQIKIWEKQYPSLTFTFIELYTDESNLFKNEYGWHDNRMLMVRYKDL